LLKAGWPPITMSVWQLEATEGHPTAPRVTVSSSQPTSDTMLHLQSDRSVSEVYGHHSAFAPQSPKMGGNVSSIPEEFGYDCLSTLIWDEQNPRAHLYLYEKLPTREQQSKHMKNTYLPPLRQNLTVFYFIY